MAQKTEGLRPALVGLLLLTGGCTVGGGTVRAGSVARPAEPAPPVEAAAGTPAATVPATAAPPGGAAEPPPSRNAGVVSLQSQAADERAAGDYERAAATLERAIRLAPQDAALWLDLATVRLAQARPDQAEGLARRAASLAGADDGLRRQAEAVAERARRAR